MIIEIRKAGFINKGAELMLNAACRRMRQEYPDALLAMAPIYGGNHRLEPYIGYSEQAKLGLLQKAWLPRYGVQWGNLLGMVPGVLRQMYGMVLDKEIDVVLDAAGFAYSEQWGEGPAIELARSCQRWHKQGTKVILLPQALGPFGSQKLKDAIKMVADHADLIFARDRISYDHLIKAVGQRSNIKMAPDFTNLLEGEVPLYFPADSARICIVPNYRMIDKMSREEADAYLPFMIKCVKLLQAKGANPFILVHESTDDLMLAQEINKACEAGLEVITESHPLKIKGILGACKGTVGSRYHGLVSALSQGVPSLTTGWSHKYRLLFEDYGFDEGVLDVLAGEDEIRQKIHLIVEADSSQQIQTTLNERAVTLKQLSEQMWQEVIGVISSGKGKLLA